VIIRPVEEAGMVEDSGVDELLRQWTSERARDAELQETNELKAAWLAEATVAAPSIPAPRGHSGSGTGGVLGGADADPAYLVAMRRRLPGVPDGLLAAAASWWQLIGDLAEAEQWWDAGISPLDQRALEYRAAGLRPADLSRRLGPLTVLDHLRRGSAPAWCVARLQRQRRDIA
jgi:hypothetical protein